jgi:spore coat polysaccharide biosynthesis protein SpsF
MLAIIQARTSSHRLKEKVLKKINNVEILKILILRLKKVKKIKKIIVATSYQKSDKKIVKLCLKNKIDYFTGPLNNVRKRFELCINKFNLKNVVMRVSADSPFIDIKLINKMIKIQNKKKNYDIVTNVYPRSFPKGQSIEIIKTKLFKKLSLKKMSPNENEHVTQYFYKRKKLFKIYNLKNKDNISKINLSIDTLNDYLFYKTFFKKRSIYNNVDYKLLVNLKKNYGKN